MNGRQMIVFCNTDDESVTNTLNDLLSTQKDILPSEKYLELKQDIRSRASKNKITVYYAPINIVYTGVNVLAENYVKGRIEIILKK